MKSEKVKLVHASNTFTNYTRETTIEVLDQMENNSQELTRKMHSEKQ